MITISGASDDLIEIEGDIDEEIGVYKADSPTFLAFSDGTVLRVEYSGNLWQIRRVFAGTVVTEGNTVYEKAFEATNPNSDQYSDIVRLHTHIEWVLAGPNLIQKAE